MVDGQNGLCFPGQLTAGLDRTKGPHLEATSWLLPQTPQRNKDAVRDFQALTSLNIHHASRIFMSCHCAAEFCRVRQMALFIMKAKWTSALSIVCSCRPILARICTKFLSCPWNHFPSIWKCLPPLYDFSGKFYWLLSHLKGSFYGFTIYDNLMHFNRKKKNTL